MYSSMLTTDLDQCIKRSITSINNAEVQELATKGAPTEEDLWFLEFVDYPDTVSLIKCRKLDAVSQQQLCQLEKYSWRWMPLKHCCSGGLVPVHHQVVFDPDYDTEVRVHIVDTVHTREQNLEFAANHTSQHNKCNRNRRVQVVEQEMDDEGDNNLEPGKGKNNGMIYVCL